MKNVGAPAGIPLPYQLQARDTEPAGAAPGSMYGELHLELIPDGHHSEGGRSLLDRGPIAMGSGHSRGELVVRGSPSAYTITLRGGRGAPAATPRGTGEIVSGPGVVLYSPAITRACQASAEGPCISVLLDPRSVHAGLLRRGEAHPGAAIPAGDGAPAVDQAFRVHRRSTLDGFLRKRCLRLARQRAQGARTGAEGAARAEQRALSARLATLAPRERAVCDRVVLGMLNKQIAAELGIAEGTVKLYRRRVMEKLGIGSAAELGKLLERLKQGG